MRQDEISPTSPHLGTSERRHVLVAAYACNPARGSEEAVGWNWVMAIARRHRITVITAAFHEADIIAAGAPKGDISFVFVPQRWYHYHPTPFWRAIEGSLAKPIMNIVYALWERDAYHLARSLTKASTFSLVHQLTYVGFRFPGRMWKLGLPFVWGPLGGLENTQWNLLLAMGINGAFYYAARNVINSAHRRWLRSPRSAIAAAGPGLIAATQGISRELKRVFGADSSVISEVVAPLHLSPRVPRARREGEPLKIIWSGVHLPGKALNLLLKGIAVIEGPGTIELHVIGDGPMRRRWSRMADNLGIDSRCVWHGLVSRKRALEIMGHGHVLVITSLKDLTSNVLVEGLALGMPVICLDHCGFSDAVTDNCGIKVSCQSIAAITSGITAGILRLERDEVARIEMAAAALERARCFSLETTSDRIEAVYCEVARAARERSP